jgi:2-keto-4-pentenoate hydratase/2-oxohepta-3-ene-1,7-dioic acid hydratase in catechol pathway
MRFVMYEKDGDRAVGVRSGDRIVATGYREMRPLLEDGEQGLDRVREALARDCTVVPDRLVAPVADRAQLIGCGGNYRDHLLEMGLSTREPVFFPKLWSSLLGPDGQIFPPEADTELDYEVELAVVIGKTARDVSPADAMDHVFGFLVINDVSARDIMKREPMQIMLCKSSDGFMPVGSDLVTPDEVDLSAARITCHVNGELRQDAKVSDMITPVPELIAFLSRYVTLSPGDVLTTGTPGGSGAGRNPEQYLALGDVVRAAVQGVGEVLTTVGVHR